ncbi:hypothetical protein GGX14DRAFT_424219 [Mycena pura]|uniref:SWI5-dependent HO expression protein 3 n=1 Tax=Mycena pura TaxID=153505 RepID=A0AAD6YMN5_9AGAR|nr:hypothetical protein GGX14DRAFT_424219 [Mycena pura]
MPSAASPSPVRERGFTPKFDRPSSRSSIRSGRAPSPSFSSDDPVAVRNQVSTIKHTIRHQQAQLQSLENMLRTGPRPYPEINGWSGESTVSSSPPNGTSTTTKRRSSYEVLQSLAGPDSNLPLPRRDATPLEDFKEGVPMASSPPSSYKRGGSPTRTLSRTCLSSRNARALADEGQGSSHRSTITSSASSSSKLSIETDATSPSMLQPPSPNPNRRLSLTPGGTTKVLADLQTGVLNARNALENTKSQLRLAQRSVAQLTRQTEDLKEARERLRLENEGLNNVVARKERLLQETIREMETGLAESTALSQKSEREYITLRDSIKGLVDGFKHDTDRLRTEMTKREEKLRSEAEAMGKKYRLLLDEVQCAGGGRTEVKRAREAEQAAAREMEKVWQEEIEGLKIEVERSNKESEEAGNTAKELADELARLRRLMQNVRQLSSSDIA